MISSKRIPKSQIEESEDYFVFSQRITLAAGQFVTNTYMSYGPFNSWTNYNTAVSSSIGPSIYSVFAIVPFDCYLEDLYIPGTGDGGGIAFFKTDIGNANVPNAVLVYSEEFSAGTGNVYFLKRTLSQSPTTKLLKGQAIHIFFKRVATNLYHGQIYLFFKKA